ncbi:MAG: hypothetical protein ACOYZ8_12260 [Chloroflexota bacterium]
MEEKCPICGYVLESSESLGSKTGDFEYFNCPCCGTFRASRSLLVSLPALLQGDDEKMILLSRAVQKMQRQDQIPYLDSYLVPKILETRLPVLADQMNNIILFVGNNTNPGEEKYFLVNALQSIMGAKTLEGVGFILGFLTGTKNYLYSENLGVHQALKMSMAGWEYYDQIKRGNQMSRKAFMAMEYGDKDLDDVFEKCFRPAVKETGYDLFRLDEKPRAGIIDDRLRVEIRTSRFLISDLTHENRGAYWEAGFAEGLGKPVIYACEKSEFDKRKTHFDTNHHLTIVWEKDKLEDAILNLKATIRATLPDEAKLVDNLGSDA